MTYLQKHPRSGVYWVRIGVPKPARDKLGRTELTRTLKTKDGEDAKRLSLPVVAEFLKRIDIALGRGSFWESHDLELVAREFGRSLGSHYGWNSPTTFENRKEFVAAFHQWVTEAHPNMTEADRDRLQEEVESDSGWYPAEPRRRPEPKLVRLSELEAKLIDHAGYTPRVTEDCRKAFAYLRELNGDCGLSRIGPEEIRELKDLLLAYPVVGRTKDLKLRDAAGQKWERTVNPKTVAKLLGFIRSGYKLAVSEGWANTNPARDIILPKRTATSKDAPREEYTPDQLTKLFTSPLFTGCQSEKKIHKPGNVQVRDYRYWAPWIALYSGARIGEICALEQTDIRCDGDVWYFNFTDIPDDESLAGQKRKKNKFSIRKTPIHQGLIDLGFVEWATAQPKGLLFPTRYKDPETFARVYSNAYRGYLKKIGLTGVGMHSFRHGFGTASRMAGLPGEIHNALAGRSQKGVGQQYGKQVRLMTELRDYINRLQFDGVPHPK